MEMENSCAAHDALLFEYTPYSNEIGVGNSGRRRFQDLRSIVIFEDPRVPHADMLQFRSKV